MSGDYGNDWPEAPWESPDETAIKTDELQAFAHEKGEDFGDGTPKDYYLPKWKGVLEGRSTRAGFNKAAFFLGHIWCFWRKQWLLGVCILFAEGILGFILVTALMVAGGSPESAALRAMPYLGILAVRIWLGFSSNRLYLRRAFRAAAAARTSTAEAQERIEFLANRGGTSFLGVLLGLMINFATILTRV